MSEKNNVEFVFDVIIQQSHIVTRWVWRRMPDLLDVYVSERERVKTDPSFRLLLAVSLELARPCGDFTAMIVIKRHLLNFNWRLLKRLAETLQSGGGTVFEAAAGTSH